MRQLNTTPQNATQGHQLVFAAQSPHIKTYQNSAQSKQKKILFAKFDAPHIFDAQQVQFALWIENDQKHRKSTSRIHDQYHLGCLGFKKLLHKNTFSENNTAQIFKHAQTFHRIGRGTFARDFSTFVHGRFELHQSPQGFKVLLSCIQRDQTGHVKWTLDHDLFHEIAQTD